MKGVIRIIFGLFILTLRTPFNLLAWVFIQLYKLDKNVTRDKKTFWSWVKKI